ncbi:hypothetical protein [Amantichitinum ursilacus]|uniref:Uncharacterized protein n=1 Tax=Amantichitinum ursilacus TaxID=857265 RepID=A0A0N0XLP7_9NEIS|nr:hypothetical protein [Amantichitinum ursilacus]KPC55383.1 hypothetical protein WG78_01960 [Amantichitinum ursilacus]
MRLTLIALLLASAPAFAFVTVGYTGFLATFRHSLTPTATGDVISGGRISAVNASELFT